MTERTYSTRVNSDFEQHSPGPKDECFETRFSRSLPKKYTPPDTSRWILQYSLPGRLQA